MPARSWLTPETLPDGFDCRAMFIPTGRDWEAILRGALLLLCDSYNFEALPGHLTADQTAGVFEDVFSAWINGDCPMFAGMVVAGACAVSPSPKWLVCDGAAYNQADYPALYAAIGVNFGVGGAGTFRVPGLAGRLPIGVGTGSGLTPRALAASGGAETHVLSKAEMPVHQHTVTGQMMAGGTGFGALQVFDGMAPLDATTSNEGSGSAHNNMPPFLALNFFIYTG
jgi:microcystin-dependent protein